MITTNLPQLIKALNSFGPFMVHDHLETIDLEMASTFPLGELDDLICDALFVDPLARQMRGERCLVHLAKRQELRGASDLELVHGKYSTIYVLQKAA